MQLDPVQATETRSAPAHARWPQTNESAAPTALSLLAMIDEAIQEQQLLQTPVAQFASRAPASRADYSHLIPLTAPRPGERYAFSVDLDACSGCKSCVAACHSLNGLDERETWRDVGLLVGTGPSGSYQQTITSACHHCEDPACLNGCPVLAYEQDPITGIVSHLDDQCIGCQYCVLKCPYDVPKFSSRLGIVRKCDLCQGRLSEGEAPACAKACPTHAISIVTIKCDSPNDFLPGAPDPNYTRPTTRYHSERPLPADAHAADLAVLRPQPAHAPLVVLLVATQVGLGWWSAAMATHRAAWETRTACVLFMIGLAASVAHLGQPRRAWRIFLGLRRSWLSREAVVFGAAAPLLALATLWPSGLRATVSAAAITAVSLGAMGILCSVMIYVDTRRPFWSLGNTLPRFAGTALIAALLTTSPHLAAAALALKLLFECRSLLPDRTNPSMNLSARVQKGPLKGLLIARAAAATAAIFALMMDQRFLGLTLFIGGELAERTLYFRAVVASKMPGHPAQ